jgi:hypothetical protein
VTRLNAVLLVLQAEGRIEFGGVVEGEGIADERGRLRGFRIPGRQPGIGDQIILTRAPSMTRAARFALIVSGLLLVASIVVAVLIVVR